MEKAVNAKVITIGRDADIKVSDSGQKISRVHCELTIVGGGYYISDMNSQNGTFIKKGGRLTRIKNAWVKPNQKLMLGKNRTTVIELLRNTQFAIDSEADFSGSSLVSRLGGMIGRMIGLLVRIVNALIPKSMNKPATLIVGLVAILSLWVGIDLDDTFVINKESSVIVFKDIPQAEDFANPDGKIKLYGGDEVKILSVKEVSGFSNKYARVEVLKGQKKIKGKEGWVLRRDLGNK